MNYERPNVAEDYVHRIGRTGRAAATGAALSLVCVDEHKLLRDIERLLKREIPRIELPGFEVDPSIKAEPIQNGRQQQGRGQGQGRGQSQGRGQGGNVSRPHSGNGQRPQGGSGARPQGEARPARRQGAGAGQAAPAANSGRRRPAPKKSGNI